MQNTTGGESVVPDTELFGKEEGTAPGNPLEQQLRQAQQHHGTIYGRDAEKRQILDAYQRVKRRRSMSDKYDSVGSSNNSCCSSDPQKRQQHRSELVLISGSSGVGKSGLANCIRNQVEDIDHSYVITVKFDQIPQPEANVPIIQALTHFAQRVIDRDDTSYFRDALLARHGNNVWYGLKTLFEAIPVLKTMLEVCTDTETDGTEETVISSRSEHSECVLPRKHSREVGLYDSYRVYTETRASRFKDALCTFIKAISTPSRPLVFLFDDMHQADECSLVTIQTLLEDNATSHTLFIGTHAGDDDVAGRTLMCFLNKLREPEIRFTRLVLSSFTELDLNTMLVDVLNVTKDDIMPLSSLLYSQTLGNLSQVWKYLRILHSRDDLMCDHITGKCCWDIESAAVVQTADESIKMSMALLPEDEQEFLKLAACLGSRLDDRILPRLFSNGKDDFARLVRSATRNGLIRYDNVHHSWWFSQSMVRRVIYDCIPNAQKAGYHYRIGRKLWRTFEMDELNYFIFVVVEQLTHSIESLNDDDERIAIAKLCHCAGVRAVQFSRFYAALEYLENGILLLGDKSWHHCYDVCLTLYSSAAEVANSLGRFEQVFEHVGILLQNANVYSDTLRARSTMVHALASSGKRKSAIQLACEVLEKLGEPFPMKSLRLRTLFELRSLRRRVRSKTNESLLRLPIMVDDDKLAAMQMLNFVFLHSFLEDYEMLPLLGIRMVDLTLKYGLCAISCIGFALFGGCLCNIENDVSEGSRMSELSFKIYEKVDAKVWLARLSLVHFHFVHAWLRPFEESWEPLHCASQLGMETGDVEFAMACKLIACFNYSEIATLPVLAREFAEIEARMEIYGQPACILMTLSKRQEIQNLMGVGNKDPVKLNGEIMDSEALVMVESSKMVYLWHQVHVTLLNLLFGNYPQAADYAKTCRVLASNACGPHSGGFVVFLCGLVDVVDARHGNRWRAPFARRCAKHLRRVSGRGECLNFLGKYYLMEAELAAMSGNHANAYRYYTSAISTSRQGNFLFQVAFSNERTARFLFERREYHRSREYFHAALVAYREWGAWAKVEHLEQEVNRLSFV